MDKGAHAHQKVFGKEIAPVDVYSYESLSHEAKPSKVCEATDVMQFSKPYLCFTATLEKPQQVLCKSSGNLKPEDIEPQARSLLQAKATDESLKHFLRKVPWHMLCSSSRERSVVMQEDDARNTKRSAYVVFGMYTHGGIVGVTKVTRQYPWLTRVLCEVFKSHDKINRVTSFGISCNCKAQAHRDKYNLSCSENTIIPLQKPRTGGGIWVEGSGFKGRQASRMCAGKEVQGCELCLKDTMHIDPRKWHETLDWEGDRVLMIGYSLSSFWKVSSEDVSWLKRHGFPFPWKNMRSKKQDKSEALLSLKSDQSALATPLREDHAEHLADEGPDAEQAGRDGRDTPTGVDQGAAFSSDRGVDIRVGANPDRTGSIEDDQSLQDQAGPTGAPRRVPPRIHSGPDDGPTSGTSSPSPDGDQGSLVTSELYGIRKVQLPHLWSGGNQLRVLHGVVHQDSPRGGGSSLEAASVCAVGTETQQVGEGSTQSFPGECHRGGDECLDGTSPDRVQPELQAKDSLECQLVGDSRQQMGDDVSGPTRPLDGQRADPREQDGIREEDRGPRGGGAPVEGDGQSSTGRIRACPEAQQGEGDLGPEDDLIAGVASSTTEEEPAPGPTDSLNFRVAKRIGEAYEEAMMGCLQGLGKSSVRLIEIGASEDSLLSRECEAVFGEGSVLRLSHWNGGDLGTASGQEYVLKTIQEEKPLCVWFSPDSVAYSPAQKFNRKTSGQAERLQAKRDSADREYEGVAKVLRAVALQGITCVLALADQCEAWKQQWMSDLQQDVELYKGSCNGCQVNLRDFQGALVCRSWGLLSTDGALIQNLSLSCDQRHAKGRGLGFEGLRQQAYTKEFGKRVARYLQRLEGWFQVARDLQGPQNQCFAAEEAPGLGPPSGDPDDLKDIPADARKRIFQNLRRIHTATGHCSKQYLKDSLKKRGANKDVMRCVEHFSCDVCKERSRADPRSPSTLVEIVPKWHTLQCDAFAWNHPESGEKWQCMLGVDEGSRLRVGRVLFQHASKTPSAQDFVDFFEGQWLPCFGRPQVLRIDPAGCFRRRVLDQYLLERHIEVQHIPAEAHWQISVVERSIQTVKAMMSALVAERPSMPTQEAFARALWATNHRDQYHGYSPLQHAFGRSPNEVGQLGESKLREAPILTESGVSAEFGEDAKSMYVAEKAFLEEQAKERIRRAELAGARPMKNFCPGDLVYAWRRMTPRADGSRHFRGGKFFGPYRVLATETRVEEGNQLRAGHVIWLYRGGQLIKAAPQQLRPATAREESWHELHSQGNIPWTIADTLRNNPPHQFEDISADSESMPSNEVLEREEERREREEPPPQPRERTPRRRVGKQRPDQDSEPVGPRANHETPRSRSPPQRGSAKGRGREPLQQDVAQVVEECGFVFPEEDNGFWHRKEAAVSLSVELPKVRSKQGKEWTRDLGCFFAKQLRRQAVEISERNLTEAEKEGFRKAKQKEVKNFIIAKAFQSLPKEYKPSRSQILRMRWILTWKVDEAPEGEPLKRDSQGNALKPKARAVVLGYMDPLYEYRPTSSPTMSRTTRQLFLQSCANRRFKVEKGDISGAFLQGDEFGPEREMMCEPLPEICEALGIPPKSTMLLTKAAYGLVEAPIQWFMTVSRFLESIGGEQQVSDPCCWSFFRQERDHEGRRICIGHVCGHVDDFLFGGSDQCPEWKAIKEKIQQRFKWGQWEQRKFTQCGVLIEETDKGFTLSQPEYLENVDEIHVSRSRWNSPGAPVTPHELHQLRSVLGALSWVSTQVAPQLSAPTGLLLSRIHSGTVTEIIETNKLLRKAKLNQHQKLLIHRQEDGEPLLAAWADAAHANRNDGGSTKGIFIGWTSRRLLQGDLVDISPIFWQSAKAHRTCRSSAAAETLSAVDAEDELYAIRLQVSEFRGDVVSLWSCDESVKTVDGVLITDSKNLYDRLNRTVMTFRGEEKRSDIESMCLKESMNCTSLNIRWVNGDSQLADSLTKESEPHQICEYHRRRGQWRIVYDPELISGRKRKQQGLDRLETKVAE